MSGGHCPSNVYVGSKRRPAAGGRSPNRRVPTRANPPTTTSRSFARVTHLTMTEGCRTKALTKRGPTHETDPDLFGSGMC